MKPILKKISDIFKDNVPPVKSKDDENEEIISAYNLVKRAVPDYNEPNYELAKKVFLEFNDFNLKKVNEIKNIFISRNVPKSLLPYPKNYIKCAYYIFLENAKKEKNLELFKTIDEVGSTLFYQYPDYKNYKEGIIRNKEMEELNENLKKTFKEGRESFKKIYGVYEISEDDYNNSPNSIDSTNEKLIYDFGVLPKIEEDVDYSKIKHETKQ